MSDRLFTDVKYLHSLLLIVTKSDWTKPGVIVAIVGVIVAVVGIVLGMDIILPGDSDKKIIATNISEMLHGKIKNDVLLVQDYLDSDEIQTPFDSKVFDDDEFLSCNVGVPNIKCPILENISEETGSEYAFLFYYPGEKIANTDRKTSSDCIIEISTLNSRITQNIPNIWNDRQWCNSSESILMTDQYNPRNKPTINVNSLLIEYFDSKKDRLGIVNAYNLEKLIKNNMLDDDLPTYNVFLFDDQNCVSAAVSKIDGIITTHMEKSIWQLNNAKNNDGTFSISEDVNNNDNCKKDYSKHNLDAMETMDVTVNESSGDEISKLNGEYYVFEMKHVTTNDLDTAAQVDIFNDWHLLVSIP